MILNRVGHAAVLLLILMESNVLASLKDDVDKVRSLGKSIGNLLQVPWIDGMNSFTSSIKSPCADDLVAVSEAFQSGEDWSIQMMDASSKIQSGITQGNFKDLGIYDQCIRVKEKYKNDRIIQGKHCMASFGLLSSSVCVPSSCNESDVRDIVNSALKNMPKVNQLGLVVSDVSCARLGNEEFTTEEILTTVFLLLVGGFILFCTVCEIVTKVKPVGESTVLDTLVKFSLCTNGIALLSTKINPKMMPAIQGIRFLSMCWVVVGHRYSNSLFMPIMINSLDFLQWTKSWTALYILTAPFAVDTFFVVSGFLMCYLYLTSKQSGKKSNFLMMYLHRYLRLTPPAAILALFVAVLLHRVANGPVWATSLADRINECRQNWWINLLYVQNLARVESMCLGHSWYLAVDMQLFWFSPIILYPLHRWRKIGLGILGSSIAASVVTPALVLAKNGYTNAIARPSLSEINLDSFNNYYIVTYTRACAYLVGILLGYDLANNKRSPTKKNVAINWSVACSFMLACTLATKYLYNTDLKYNVIMETLFAVTLRPFWSIAMAWIIYACTQGYGGLVTKFLSLPIFLPLSRLSYCIYLVHMVIQKAKNAAIHTPDRFSDSTMLEHFCADLVLSIVVAFFLSLFFESPVVVLEKILKAPRRKEETLIMALDSKKEVEGETDNRCIPTANGKSKNYCNGQQPHKKPLDAA